MKRRAAVRGEATGAGRFWRSELRKDLAWLRKRRGFRKWSEKRMVLYERRLVLVGAQIRILLDRSAVAPALVRQPLGCVSYPGHGAAPTSRVHRGDVPALFDLDAPGPDSLTAGQLCDRLLHHHLMAAVSGRPRRFTHLWVFSDQEDDERLYELEMKGMVEYFTRFAHEDAAATEIEPHEATTPTRSPRRE